MKIVKSCEGKKLNKPFKSNRKFKKRQVCVKKNGIIRAVHYGDTRYKDFTQHKDKSRREGFRKRMRCNPVRLLDKTTPRYWACQDLW